MKTPYKLDIWLNELKKLKEDPIRKSGLCNRIFPTANNCFTTFTARTLHF